MRRAVRWQSRGASAVEGRKFLSIENEDDPKPEGAPITGPLAGLVLTRLSPLATRAELKSLII